MSSFPTACTQVDFGFPKLVILAHVDLNISPAGDVPTVAEFQAAISTGGSDIIVLTGLANGVKVQGEQTTISDADTVDNLPEVISSREGITGNLKRFNLTTLADLEALNCHTRLRMWYVTSNDYCFGGTRGYIVSNYISDWVHDGYGNRSYIPLSYYWIRPTTVTTGAAYESGYLDLTNAS